MKKQRLQLITQSDQVVERIEKKCSGSACDSSSRVLASAREAKLAEIETKRLLAQVDAKSMTDTGSVASDSKQ